MRSLCCELFFAMCSMHFKHLWKHFVEKKFHKGCSVLEPVFAYECQENHFMILLLRVVFTVASSLLVSLSLVRHVCQAFHKCSGGKGKRGRDGKSTVKGGAGAGGWAAFPRHRIKGLINLKYFPASEALD